MPTFDSAIITGGSGALGTLVSAFLQPGCAHVVLLSRRAHGNSGATSADTSGALQSILCDISAAADLAAVETPRAGAGRVALIHAGGVLQDGLLAHQTAASLRRAFAPKVTVAAAGRSPLGACGALSFHSEIHFSSIAALLGSAGQASYAAANAALDGLAAKRADMGIAACSVQWGPWAGAGMAAAHAGTARRLAIMGLRALPEAAGLRALGALLSGLVSGAIPATLSAVVADMDLARLASSGPAPAQKATRTLLAALGARAGAVAETAKVQVPPAAAAALAASADRVRETVIAAVERLVGRPVDFSEPLTMAGVDSLGALELRTQLSAALKLELPATLAYDFPTVDAIVSFASSALGAAEQPRAEVHVLALRRPEAAAAEAEPCLVLALGGARTRDLWAGAAAAMPQDGVGLVPLFRWATEGAAGGPRFLASLPMVELFDAEAFSVSPTEAAVMDPHQRLLLQVPLAFILPCHSFYMCSGIQHGVERRR